MCFSRLLLWAAVFATIVSSGCRPRADQTDQRDTRPYTVGISLINTRDPWRAQMKTELEEAVASRPNLRVQWYDANNDKLKQRLQIEEFVRTRGEAIIIAHNDPVDMAPVVAKAYDAEIKVILLGRSALNSKFTSLIQTNYWKQGAAAGEWLAQRLGGKGNIVELKCNMTSNPQGWERQRGFRDALKHGDQRFTIVYESDVQDSKDKAIREMKTALEQPAPIAAVFAHSDVAAYGAYLAAKDAGRKDIVFVSTGGLAAEGQVWIREGVLDACISQPTGAQEAIGLIDDLSRGGQAIPQAVEPRLRLYTKENVDRGGELVGDLKVPMPEER